MLLTAGDNPDRLHSEQAFARLTGSCPLKRYIAREDDNALRTSALA